MGTTKSLTYLLEHLATVVGKQTDQLLQQQLCIGASQYKILITLQQHPRIQQKAIADHLGQTEASISRQIKLLQSKGLVALRINPTNRRQHIIQATQTGAQITHAASDLIRRNFDEELSTGDDHPEQLVASLDKLHKLVCQPGNIGACDHPLRL